MTTIAIGLSLIALTGGAFLLAKTKKDLLSSFYKGIAYFVIIAGFLNILSAGLHGTMKFYGMKHSYKMRMHEGYMKDQGFHHHGMKMACSCNRGYDDNCCCQSDCKMNKSSCSCGMNKCCENTIDSVNNGRVPAKEQINNVKRNQ
jgi:hypothetical protein